MPERQWYNLAVQLERLQSALERTRRTAFGRLAALLGASELSLEFWDDLESTLLAADMGLPVSSGLVAELRGIAARDGLYRAAELRPHLESALLRRIRHQPLPPLTASPRVFLILGVNGSGKTTSAAKLAHWYQQAGARVLLVAADTYRAAAVEQLQVWGKRLDLPLIHGEAGSDPGAVVYQTGQAVQRGGHQVAIIDTSGRMHTSHNLMAELGKIRRVVGKVLPEAEVAPLLVLDATTGQNGLTQTRAFKDEIELRGVILAKLDSSAKGGVVFAVGEELNTPVLFVGLGERAQDFDVFQPQAFIDGILEGSDN